MQQATESSIESAAPAQDGFRVDHSSAEQLARSFEHFSPVAIRETLEFEPFTEALRLLTKFSKTAEPYRELKHHAMVNELGYYRAREKRPSAREEYERYLAFVEIKDSANWAKNGTRLTASEREGLTRLFYAPAYRVEMAKLAAESWDPYRGRHDASAGHREKTTGAPPAADPPADKKEVA